MFKLNIIHILGTLEIAVIFKDHIIFEDIALLSSIPAWWFTVRIQLTSYVAAVEVPHDHFVAVAGMLDWVLLPNFIELFDLVGISNLHICNELFHARSVLQPGLMVTHYVGVIELWEKWHLFK